MTDPAIDATVRRHGVGARILHAGFAIVILGLVVTGLALGERLGDSLVAALGGHTLVGWVHRQSGFLVALAVIGAFVFVPATFRLVREMLRFRPGDGAWFRGFTAYCLAPRDRPAPHHDGRFDPGQRIVFLAMVAVVLVLATSGIVMYLVPTGSPTLFGWAIRAHVGAALLLGVSVVVHIIIGSGLLPSHRGVARGIFGDGRVRTALANRLWPDWATRGK